MGNPTLPSAQRGFTSEFGKGSGGSLLLLSPANCLRFWVVLFTYKDILYRFSHLLSESVTERLDLSLYCSTCSLTKSSYIFQSILSIMTYATSMVLYSQASRAISIGQLHTSPCFHTQPINVLVSNGSLGDISLGKSYLEVGFPLRCFQRLSLPNIATRRCHWRDNRYTRGSSTLVLSY